jgi:type II secretory pathway component PulM
VTTQLRTFWALRTSRERVVIATVAALAGALLLLGLMFSANRARSELRSSVTALQSDAMRLDRDAAEIERLRMAPQSAPPSQRDLRVLLEAQANATGLSGAVVRVEAAGPDTVSVVLGAVAFSDWLTLVQRLQSQRVRVESTRIEALSASGMVSVTATFTRAATL